MRRFDRLRKLAREYAKAMEHDLGVFSLPTNLIGEWYTAKCVKCGLVCRINMNLNPNKFSGLNPKDPGAEIFGLRFAFQKNNEALAVGKKKKGPAPQCFKDDLPFPKRSRGLVTGPALHNKCGTIKK